MEQITSKEQMLELVREDRPNQQIHTVLNYRYNDNGYYDVEVDMVSNIVVNRRSTTVEHTHCTIQYPLQIYSDLVKQHRKNILW